MEDADKPHVAVDSHDAHKGAKEEDRKGPVTPDRPQLDDHHPALDENGMPNDPIAIARDRIGANVDESQG